MAKRIEVAVRRNPENKGSPTYAAAVFVDERLRDMDTGATRTDSADEAIHWVGQMLASVFEAGDIIDYCGVSYSTLVAAVDAVRVARLDWE